MDTVVMKNIFRYDTRYIVDRWNLDVILVPVEEKMKWSGTCMPADVLNSSKFRSWRGCSDVPSKCR